MKWAIILFFFLLLFFIPIPIKIRLIYKNKILNLYLYSFKININKRLKKFKEKPEKPEKRKESDNNGLFSLSNIKVIVHKISCSRFKPTLRLSIEADYGLIDASCTGIAYGVMHSASPFLYEFFAIVFKIKKYKLNLKPDFNQLKLSIVIESIIFFNLAKIIYMAFLIIKTIRTIKKADKCTCANA